MSTYAKELAARNGLVRAATAIGLLTMLGCTASSEEEVDHVGEARIAIAVVPQDVACVRITAQGTRILTRDFAVTPGGSTQLPMSGLPLGAVEFRGAAFAVSCAALGAAPEESWISDPTTVTIARGVTAQVTLGMRRNGRVAVDVDFDDCATGLIELQSGSEALQVTPYALNESGQVVGEMATATSVSAFLWQSGKFQLLQGPAGVYASASAINNHGQVMLRVDDRTYLWETGVFRDLGTLGGSWSYGEALNDAGQVVGRSQNAQGEEHAFLWHAASGMVDLGTLGGTSSEARAINATGTVVGYGLDEAGNTHAFVWSAGTMRDVGTLGGNLSYATAVNGDGVVIGVSTIEDDAEQHAFVWANERMRDIGTLGGNWSDPRGINALGQVVGVSGTASGSARGYLWEGGAIQDLGTLGGLTTDLPPQHAIDDAGRITGSSETALGEMHAFVWEAGIMHDIGVQGAPATSADGLNSAGQIVMHTDAASGRRRALFYDPSGCAPAPGTSSRR